MSLSADAKLQAVSLNCPLSLSYASVNNANVCNGCVIHEEDSDCFFFSHGDEFHLTRYLLPNTAFFAVFAVSPMVRAFCYVPISVLILFLV